MAPEGHEDARSDLYSLGVVFYEMLAGVPPFTGDSMHAVIRQHMTQPPDLSTVTPFARELVAVLLAKRPEDRPAAAAALALLPAVVSKKPSPPRMPAPPPRRAAPAAVVRPPTVIGTRGDSPVVALAFSSDGGLGA